MHQKGRYGFMGFKNNSLFHHCYPLIDERAHMKKSDNKTDVERQNVVIWNTEIEILDDLIDKFEKTKWNQVEWWSGNGRK